MPPTPWRTQAATASRKLHCARTVARLIDSPSNRTAAGHYRGHPVGGELGVAEHAGRIGKAEELGKMEERACPLLGADHMEVILEAVEIGEEDHAGLVEAGRCLEDM